MAGPALSETQPGMEETPKSATPLTRREFLRFSGLVLGSTPFLDGQPGAMARESLGFFNTMWGLYSLDIVPDSVKVDKDVDDFWRPTGTLSFISRRTDILPPDTQESLSYPPRASKVSITLETPKDAANLGALIINAKRIGDAVEIAKHVGLRAGTAALVASINGTDIKKWWSGLTPAQQKGIKRAGLAAGVVSLVGGVACGFAAKELVNKVQANPTSTATLEALINLATTIPVPPSPEGQPTPKIEVTPLPVIPIDFPSTSINTNYLQTEGSKVADVIATQDQDHQPQPTLVGNGTTESTPRLDDLAYAKTAFATGSLNLEGPFDALKYIVAQAPRLATRKEGEATYYTYADNGDALPFSGLTFYREQLDLRSLDSPQYPVLEGCYPPGLVLREGAGITVVGRTSDGNIVIAFEEYLPRNGETEMLTPRIRFAVLSETKFGDISRDFLPNLQFFVNQNEMTFTDNTGVVRKVGINIIGDDIRDAILKEVGEWWIDVFHDESGKAILFPTPTVPHPSAELLQSLGITDRSDLSFVVKENKGDLGNPRCMMLWAKDQDGKYVMVARYDPNKKEWRWHFPPYLRDIGEQTGMIFNGTVDGAEQWQDPEYIRAAAEHFSGLIPSGAFMQSVKDTWGDDQAYEYRRRATRDGQILRIGGFNHNDVRESLQNASDEDVIRYMEERAKYLLSFVKRVDTGTKPTHINFLSEALWYSKLENRTGYEPSPFQRVFCAVKEAYKDELQDNHIIAKTYLMFARIAQEMGLVLGRDFRLIYNDYNIYSPQGGKAQAVVQELQRAKEEIAGELGIQATEVQLDVGTQCRWFLHDSFPYSRQYPWENPPTEAELMQTFQLLGTIGRVHADEVEIAGAENPDELMTQLQQVFRAAYDSGVVDSLTLWNILRFASVPGQKYAFVPTGLFDGKYQPTESYKALIQEILPRVTLG